MGRRWIEGKERTYCTFGLRGGVGADGAMEGAGE